MALTNRQLMRKANRQLAESRHGTFRSPATTANGGCGATIPNGERATGAALGAAWK
jgi:hypothetical protein